MKKNLRAAPAGLAVLLLCAALFVGWYLFADHPSKYTGGPAEGYVLVDWQTEYPMGTTGLTVRVANNGTYSREFNHPFVERERDGKWYRLERQEPDDRMANLLYVVPGDTGEFGVGLTGYRLEPGNYRAVFVFVDEGNRYFDAPFTLTEN